MQDFKYYSTKPIPHPSRKEFNTLYVYSKGKLVWSGNPDECPHNPTFGVRETDVDENGLKSARSNFFEHAAALHDEFKRDLFREFGMQSHPMRDKAFQLAWDHGHSAGYQEVYGLFEKLVELLD